MNHGRRHSEKGTQDFYWVKPAEKALQSSESHGHAHVILSLLLFFVTSVAVFGSRIRFLP